jgi:hypothetical protein
MKKGELFFILFLCLIAIRVFCGNSATPADSKPAIDTTKQYEGYIVQMIIDKMLSQFQQELEVVRRESIRDVVFPLLMEIEYLKKHIREYGQMVLLNHACLDLKQKKLDKYKKEAMAINIICITAGVGIGVALYAILK